MRRLPAVLALLALASVALATPPPGVDPALLSGLKARSIGPAAMSGRIAAIDAVESNPDVIVAGVATGGVWRSDNGGITWTPIFDQEKVAAVGAVAIFQPSPDVIWVGTGEGNPRNSASVGNGIYRSLDGGRHWTHLGLDATERIHRIVLHPTNPDVAWVAAMGRMWGENPERGVYRTSDGGKTWQRALFVDERTGCAELVADPTNPNKLLAAMWDYRRWPYSFRSGGPGSGLWVTHDGGTTWTRLTEDDGLPRGELGRIGIAVCRSHPEVVYAVVEATKSALLRSEDGGRTWTKVNEQHDVADRPFYYADLRVDPEYPNRLYSLASLLKVSDDSGSTFRPLTSFRTIHPDFHALWIDPGDPSHLVVGNDGGVGVSWDRGRTWRFVGNLPLGQYYHVNVDMDVPYNVYGGLQDNGSWRGPSEVWESGGIRNQHWQEVGFGDGFDVSPDPADSLRGYSMSQEGNLRRWNLHTGEQKEIKPAAPEGSRLRFNWNAGFAQDPFDAATIYYGSQLLHRSTDRGDSWTAISPDLTTNNPEWQKQSSAGGLTPDVTGAENYTTIVAIAPSPRQKGVIWVGTDDGRVQVTRDGGATWTSVERNLKGVPANTWVPHVEASPHDAGTAFVVLDDHRRSNWTPYVQKTTDYGATWTSLASKDIWGYCLAIEQDPVDPKLLFLGTEFGLYVSQDGGTSWWRFTHGLPTVSVMDLVVHPREHDLLVATHGRSLYIVDDIRPLRTLSPATMAEPVHLFPAPDALQHVVRQSGGERFPGDDELRGESRPYGAMLTFSLNAEGLPHPDEEVERERKAKAPPKPEAGLTDDDEKTGKDRGPRATITVAEAGGAVIRTFKAKVTQGLNRAVWNLRRDPFRTPPGEDRWWEDEDERAGPEVPAGTYDVTVAYKGHTATARVKVLPDPRMQVSEADRDARWKAILRAGALQETLADAVQRIVDTRTDIDAVTSKIKAAQKAEKKGAEEAGDVETAAPDTPADPRRAILNDARALKEKLTAVEKKLRVPPKTKGIVDYDDVLGKVREAVGALSSSWSAPTAVQLDRLAIAERALAKVLPEVNELFARDVAAFRQKVRDAGIALLEEKPPLGL
ncbi:MAG: WD40/YVTN/BNR-like repeat-containing protein [Thermoanaerobaculaceae bacterium]